MSETSTRPQKYILALLLGAALCVTGCATTAKSVTTSSIKTSAAPQSYTAQAPEGTVLAVVRYPAFVDAEAADLFYQSFATQSIGGNTGKFDMGSPEVEGLADSVILKSNYFALSLYKELAAKLPDHSVLLSPHVIKKTTDGKLTSEPMTQAESLANVVSIDFVSYTFPDTSKMMGSEPLTFGDLVTPLVVVKTDYRAAVATQGLLLASQPLIPFAAGNGRSEVSSSLESLQKGRLTPQSSELDFISFLNGDAAFGVDEKPLQNLDSVNAVRGYPIEKIQLDTTALKDLDLGDVGVTDPLKNSFSEAFADQIIGIINRTDINKAAMAGQAAAIAQFDESLAALTLVGSDDPAYQARLRYAERLLEAEKKYLSVQSLRLFDGVHNGEMGAQVRDMLMAEYKILEQRRSLARQQNAAMAMAILGAVAAGGMIANEDDSQNGVGYGEQLAIEALIQGAVFAGTQAYTINQRSKTVGGNYLASIIPALDEQTTVQVSLIDSNETITAIRYEDLKSKLQALYTNNQRALDTVATRCAFTETGTAKTGTWLGECNGGYGEGSGVGVLRNDDGTSVEYFGYAKAGQPFGPGYMIFHMLNESFSLEGNFTQGLADGTMRLSKSGQSDTLRLYQAGNDTGNAPRGSFVNSPFNIAAAAEIN